MTWEIKEELDGWYVIERTTYSSSWGTTERTGASPLHPWFTGRAEHLLEIAAAITARREHVGTHCAVTPHGIDADFWSPRSNEPRRKVSLVQADHIAALIVKTFGATP